jgi:hypothetical protein
MTDQEKELLARLVEGLLMLDSSVLPRAYSVELLDAAHRAGITKHMPNWQPNLDRVLS